LQPLFNLQHRQRLQIILPIERFTRCVVESDFGLAGLRFHDHNSLGLS
jgi:hypothetical protein